MKKWPSESRKLFTRSVRADYRREPLQRTDYDLAAVRLEVLHLDELEESTHGAVVDAFCCRLIKFALFTCRNISPTDPEK